MDYGMMKQDATKYENEVRNYVGGVLTASLSAGVDLDIAREKENLALLSKLLGDTELRNQIVERIVEHGIKYSMSSYKINLSDELRETIFMRRIYSFLDMQQIATLAKHFDRQITEERTQKHSR